MNITNTVHLTFKLMYTLNSSIQPQRICCISILEVNISFFSPKPFPLLLSFSSVSQEWGPHVAGIAAYAFVSEVLKRFRVTIAISQGTTCWGSFHVPINYPTKVVPIYYPVGGQELERTMGAHSITQHHSGLKCRLADSQQF